MGDEETKKLAPTERLLNIAKAAAIIVPLFGAGLFAGNTDTVHNWLAPDDTLPTTATADEQNRIINEKFAKIDAEIEALKSAYKNADQATDRKLRSMIRANSEAIEYWHGTR